MAGVLGEPKQLIQIGTRVRIKVPLKESKTAPEGIVIETRGARLKVRWDNGVVTGAQSGSVRAIHGGVIPKLAQLC